MKKEKLLSLFQGYAIKLNVNDVVAKEMPKDLKTLPYSMVPREVLLSHVAFMCEKAVEFVETGHTEKAMRWLGFIQAMYYATDFCSIDDLKEHSRPDPIDPEAWRNFLGDMSMM